MLLNNFVFAQNLTDNYVFTIISQNFKGEIKESKLNTFGTLPIFDNHKDEITIGNQKFIKESFLNIQVLSDKDNKISVELDFKNNEKNYKKTIELEKDKLVNMTDFQIKVEKK